jgi:hypothetical protein
MVCAVAGRNANTKLTNKMTITHTYHVNEIGFSGFIAAVRYAETIRGNVIETATSKVRWSPTPPVSAAKMRKYRDHKNAYAAQCLMNATA